MNAKGKKRSGAGPKPKGVRTSGRRSGGGGGKAEQPLAQARRFANTSARVTTSNSAGQRSCTIRHSELFATVSSRTTFDPYSYLINPGQTSVFPWLSVQAAGWERYRFKKLRFEFLSRVAATTSGAVTLGVDYDVADAPPDSELTLMSYQNSVQDAPWKNQQLILSKESLNAQSKYRYVHTTDVVPSTAEARQDYAGKLFVQALGATAGLVFGTLVVHYEVEFVTPQLSNGATASNHITIPAASGASPQAMMGAGAVGVGTVSMVQQSLGIPGTISQGTRFLLDGLIPGQIYRGLFGATGTNFVSGTPFIPHNLTWAVTGSDFLNPTAYSVARDFILTDPNDRTAWIDFIPNSATATVTSGTGVFSFSNLPNLDPVE